MKEEDKIKSQIHHHWWLQAALCLGFQLHGMLPIRLNLGVDVGPEKIVRTTKAVSHNYKLDHFLYGFITDMPSVVIITASL